VYFRDTLTKPSAFGKPLIPSDKKLWQKLADEHNEELRATGMPASKTRTSKSVRDKWRYKVCSNLDIIVIKLAPQKML
jgi:hypothetical protein